MTTQFNVFSDVSYCERLEKMNYAAVIACGHVLVDQWVGTIPNVKQTTIAEVIASSLAVENVPSGSIVTVHTDITLLVNILKSIHRTEVRNRFFRFAINRLLIQLRRMSSYRCVSVHRRDKFYKWCHKAAWEESRPHQFTWQYWRAQKQAKPQPLRYPLGRILNEVLGDKFKTSSLNEIFP